MKKITTTVWTIVLILFAFCAMKEFRAWKLNTNRNIFGIDVSHYNGDIEWEKVDSKHPVRFVIARSSMGKNRKDKRYKKNIQNARKRGFIVGSYHYYDPNEDSTEQAKNFLSTIDLRKGDIRPVIDIEQVSKIQSMAELRKGLENCLKLVEEGCGVRPIIYTGLSYYKTYLRGFEGYPLWIAAYSEKRRGEVESFAHIMQFSEKVRIPGIRKFTDGNDIFKGKFRELLYH